MTTSPVVIGIAGGSGSEKSWFANKRGDAFPDDATIIEQGRFERKLNRDVLHRGYSKEQITQSWQERTAPMFERFVAPSAIHADKVWNPLRDNAFENSFLADLRNQLANNEKRKP